MNAVAHPDLAVSRIAAAIGEPARVRMLYCLLDGHARTSTELAVVAEVSASTASAHLSRLKEERLVRVFVQGKHRYYSLEGTNVANALEGLSILAGGKIGQFVPNTPNQLRAARTCYDHIAGTLGVQLHDQFKERGWITADSASRDDAYELTGSGAQAIAALGADVSGARSQRRRFAYACLDWSERKPHIGGALGAVILKLALKRRWLAPDLDSRALSITTRGRREMANCFGLLGSGSNSP